MISRRFTPAPFPDRRDVVADKQPPAGSPHEPAGSRPKGSGTGKPSPAHGIPAAGAQRPGKLTPGAGTPTVGSKGNAGGKSEVDRALLLRDVMDHAVRVHKETTGPRGIGGVGGVNRSAILTAVCVPLLAFCVYSWVARPEFLWGPKAGPLPPARQDANTRFAMFMLAQRIKSYRATQGHYPATLEELGETLPGVVYSLGADGVFQLTASENGKSIMYRSDQPTNAFLGNSFDVIQGSGK